MGGFWGLQADITVDTGYRPEILGEYTARQEARNGLFGAELLSLLRIVLILDSDFESTRIALLLTFGLPFALVGAPEELFHGSIPSPSVPLSKRFTRDVATAGA